MTATTSPALESGLGSKLLSAGYQDVMVHLDGSEGDELRLMHAETLASLSHACLLGLYINPLPDLSLYSAPAGAVAITAFAERLKEDGTAAFSRLGTRFGRLSVKHELHKLEDVMAFLSGLVLSKARAADIFCAPCPYRRANCRHWDHLVEAILFEAGHGVYLVPPQATHRGRMNNVVIGWSNTKEAARAIAEAMSILVQARQTEVVYVRDMAPMGSPEAQGLADLKTHLARHDVHPSVTVLETNQTVATTLLETAHRADADLIICGAYGHSRLRETILGGVTKDLLRTSDIPLLMAH